MGTILVDNEGIKGTISEKEENIRKFFIQLEKNNKFKGIEKKVYMNQQHYYNL